MNEYELIYEKLCERVECGELSLEDAEIINDVAYDRYVKEDMSDITRRNAERLKNLHNYHGHDYKKCNKNDLIFNEIRERPRRKYFKTDAEFKKVQNTYDHGYPNIASRSSFNKINNRVSDAEDYRLGNETNKQYTDYCLSEYNKMKKLRNENKNFHNSFNS